MAIKQTYRYPSSTQVTIAAIGLNDLSIPTSSILIGGESPSGILRPIAVDENGEVQVDVTSIPLPPGASTLAEQQAQTALLTTIDASNSAIEGSTAAIDGKIVVVDTSSVTVIASALPAGAATEATLASIDTKTPVQGQALMAGSSPVVIASDQSTLPVSAASLPLPAGAATEAKQDSQITEAQTANTELAAISGDTAILALVDFATEATLSAVSAKLPASLSPQLMSGSLSVTVASNQSDIPVSLASLPLPAGAATLAEQQAQTALLTTIDTSVADVATSNSSIALSTAAIEVDSASIDASLISIDTKTPVQGQALMVASVPVVIASDQSTLPVSAASLPLPAGAATEATLASIDTKTPVQGQAVMAASVPVVIASNQSPLPISISSSAGRTLVTSTRRDYVSGSVTTGAWVQLVASTSAAVNLIEIFDSSGQTMEIGVGAASSEVRVCLVFPGGNGQVPLAIAAASRISIRAVSATASVGENDINYYS